MNRMSLATIVCVLAMAGWAAAAGAGLPLADTKSLEWPEADLSGRLMDGAHRFIDEQIRAARAQRSRFWKYDTSSRSAYEASVAENRQQLRQIIGAVDPRLPTRMEQFGDDNNPACVAETSLYRVFQVRWPVLDGVFGEGLLVQPRAAPSAHVVVVPDADQTPEQILGLAPALAPESQFARRLAEHGFELVIPTLVSRRKLDTDDPGLKKSDQTYREWIYRQAFHMGRHIIGYEVQKVLAAVDWFEKRDGLRQDRRAGLRRRRPDRVLCGGARYADRRRAGQRLFRFPRKRVGGAHLPQCVESAGAVWRCGDCLVDSAAVAGGGIQPGADGDGPQGGLAHAGVLVRSRRSSSASPWPPDLRKPVLVHNDGQPTGPGSVRALEEFAQRLGVRTTMSLSTEIPAERRSALRPEERHNRAVQQLEDHVQSLVRSSEHVRDRFFLYKVMPELAERRWSTERRHDTHSVEKFTRRCPPVSRTVLYGGHGTL